VSTRIETLDLKAEASAAGDSRRFVRRVCSSWALGEERIDTAALLVSELVTNAVEAPVVPACADLQVIGVRLVERKDSFVIEVWDTSPQPPRLIESSEDSEDGRGLQLVHALSIRWGYCGTGTDSKVVWCELSRDIAPDTNSNDNQAPDEQPPKSLNVTSGTSRCERFKSTNDQYKWIHGEDNLT
jgi:anti-sigma regulatory factor (Ser/Thr protein kinase)